MSLANYNLEADEFYQIESIDQGKGPQVWYAVNKHA